MIEANLPTFLAHTAGEADRSGLPDFVKREFGQGCHCSYHRSCDRSQAS
jgi:hypothetical protein